jgi:hypothetical protein
MGKGGKREKEGGGRRGERRKSRVKEGEYVVGVERERVLGMVEVWWRRWGGNRI